MTDMPMSPLPDAPTPMDPSQGAPGMDAGPPPLDPSMMQGADQHAPVAPVQDTVVEDAGEMEARDRLELELLLAATQMCKAASMATAGSTPTAVDAEKYAAAAQHFTQAAVLLAPQEAVDDADAAGQVPSAAAKAQILNTTTRGVRRTAGS